MSVTGAQECKYDLHKKEQVCVLGGGSFGTALGFVLATNGHSVSLLTRRPEVAEGINENHMNPVNVTGHLLPENLTATTHPEEALGSCTFILHVIPVQSSPEYLGGLKDFIKPGVPIISSSKGLHASSLKYMSDIIPEALGRDQPTAFLSGPSFARELLKRELSAVVVASEEEDLSKKVQAMFANQFVRIYRSDDVLGVEVGGALKNILAIGAGVLDGAGYGPNSVAALLTRGTAEISRLAVAMGAKRETLGGLSGIGDIMLTCYGAQSRNRTVGTRIGKGESIEDIMEDMEEVAEGVHTTPAAVKLAEKYRLHTPILSTVNNLLNGSDVKEEIARLMRIPQMKEFGDEYYETL